jgi:hypothetical protein
MSDWSCPNPAAWETPMLGKPWCPGCEPNRDPTREILNANPCGRHRPGKAPDDDQMHAILEGRKT